MTKRLFLLCLMLAALLLVGCSKPWSNPDIKDDRQAKLQFDKDSLDCQVASGEKHPLNKNMQDKAYDLCMEDKGWLRERPGDGIAVNFNKKK